jgi:vancomycin resistance protein VanJ
MKPGVKPTMDVASLLESEKQASRLRWLRFAAWVNVLLLLIVWMVMLTWGDVWWPGTLLMYGPRWVAAVPLILLLVIARERSRRMLLPLLLAVIILLFPLLGTNVPVNHVLSTASEDPARLRIVTFNAHGGKFRHQAWQAYLKKVNADVVLCQEWLPETRKPDAWGTGWKIEHAGNSLLIASRFPLGKVQCITEVELRARGYVAGCEVQTPAGPVNVINVHLPTMRGEAGEADEVVRGKLNALMDLDTIAERRLVASKFTRDWLTAFSGPLIVAGDFNLTTDSPIYSEAWGKFTNAFSQAGWGWGQTKWTRWYGVRIDHILYEPGWKCADVAVGPDVGSDHLPVMAELVFTGGGR